jgi:CRISPR-associated endonuclease/helicase Cas3
MGNLGSNDTDWTLVATSCVEAGVDLSFRTAFRQTFSTASIIQVGGRVNRHGEYNDIGGSWVYDFDLQGDHITANPAARVPSSVLRSLLNNDGINGKDPADVVSNAMKEEVRQTGNRASNIFCDAERDRDYPQVSRLGRVIDADTRIVVIDTKLAQLVEMRRPVSFRSLLAGSVQLWAEKIARLSLEPLPGKRELYRWSMDYDPEFLGIMAGVLGNEEYAIAGGYIID